jgi:hypothetical protein
MLDNPSLPSSIPALTFGVIFVITYVALTT